MNKSMTEPTNQSFSRRRWLKAMTAGSIASGVFGANEMFASGSSSQREQQSAGTFVIGTVEIKSNVTLHIAAQGKLLGSADGKQYRAVDAIPLRGDSTLNDGNVGLIFAVKAENFTIEGPGTIDGQGAQFRSPERGVPPPSGRGGNNRPYHLLFHQCRNVTVRDIFLTQS